MTRLEEVTQKLCLVSVEHIAFAAAKRYHEPPHVARWMQNVIRAGSLPGLVAQFCDEVLALTVVLTLPKQDAQLPHAA